MSATASARRRAGVVLASLCAAALSVAPLAGAQDASPGAPQVAPPPAGGPLDGSLEGGLDGGLDGEVEGDLDGSLEGDLGALEPGLDLVDEPGVQFKALPNAALLELYTDVGEILRERDVIRPDWNPAQDYAEHLAKQAFLLDPAPETPGLMRDAQGALVRVVGLRRHGLDETPLLPSAALPKAGGAERMVVILFERDYQLSDAAIAPAQAVAAKAGGGAVALDEAFFAAPEIQSVSARLYRFAGEDFE